MKKVVIIGGGTGLSSLLRGLKEVEGIELYAIVSVADDGGSTGKIRLDYKIPAVGDLRQVITSLSEKESIVDHIMQYRFKANNEDSGLSGHSLGNLILAALVDIEKDFYKGIEKITDVLKLKGQVLPITDYHDITLKATYTDGSSIIGESNIPNLKKKIKFLECLEIDKVHPNPIAIEAILKADVIILGVGSLYTSLIANLVVPKVKDAIIDNKSANIIYVSNIMTQPGETDNMNISDHIKAIEEHLEYGIIDKVVVHSTKIPTHILQKYAKEKSYPVKLDSHIYDSHVEVCEADLLDSSKPIIRHDAKKIRKVFKTLLVSK